MSSSKEYLQWVQEVLLPLQDRMVVRSMMGEYLLYLDGILWGGIYDDRLLCKNVKIAQILFSDSKEEIPYKGAKAMLLIDIEQENICEKIEKFVDYIKDKKECKR